jgi:hypothetical protein
MIVSTLRLHKNQKKARHLQPVDGALQECKETGSQSQIKPFTAQKTPSLQQQKVPT